MNVVLIHPDHGAKVATLDAELVEDLKKGWTRFEPKAEVVVEKPVLKRPRKAVEPVEEIPGFLTAPESPKED